MFFFFFHILLKSVIRYLTPEGGKEKLLGLDFFELNRKLELEQKYRNVYFELQPKHLALLQSRELQARSFVFQPTTPFHFPEDLG